MRNPDAATEGLKAEVGDGERRMQIGKSRVGWRGGGDGVEIKIKKRKRNHRRVGERILINYSIRVESD
jgi:hypothetical protein